MLLVDEIDRSDHEFEALLLEFLSDFQITIPERGTIVAPSQPLVVLTSNRTRELAEALRRRCVYHWIAYPDAEREAAIIMLRAGDVAEATARAVAKAVGEIRAQPAGQAARHRRGGRMGECRDHPGKGRQPMAGSLPPRASAC